jgi:hypothetical protein
MSPPQIHVTVPYDPPPEVHAVFYEQLGVVPTVVRADQDRGADDLPVYVIVATALAPFLKGLLETMGTQAGTALSNVLGRLLRPRGSAGPSFELRLVDERHRITVVVDPATAEDVRAFAKLAELPREGLKEGTLLRWDPKAAVWRSS